MSAPEAADDVKADDLGVLVQRLVERLDAMPQMMDDEHAERIYTGAYHMMQQAQFDKAMRVLALLTLYRPNSARYWHALGLCCRRLNDADGAFEAFSRAVDIDPEDANMGCMLVESLLHLGYRAEAANLLEMVATVAQERRDRAALSRAEGLRELMARPVQ
jgi:predicted Zn-dependent protease